MVKIFVENVTHIYGKNVEALNNVTIEFEKGKLSAILGPSGCGKTTLLRIIAGLLRPTYGRIYFDDVDVTDFPPEKRNVGMVFQFPVVYPTLSIYENLALPARAQKIPETEIRRRIKELSEFLEFEEPLDKIAGKLSAEEKQKVALARALMKNSNCLLLDEPLTNIDPAARITLRRKIVDLKLQKEVTIIYVTHDQTEACSLGDKIAVMKDGKVLQYGILDEIYNYPKNTFIGFFLGSPGMNFINCRLVSKDSEKLLEFEDVRIKLPKEIAYALEGLSQQQLILGIRPEYLQVVEKESNEGIPFKVEYIEYLGSSIVATLTRGETMIKIRCKPDIFIKENELLHIKIPYEYMRIFDSNGNLIV